MDVEEFTPSQVLQGVLQCRGATEKEEGGRNLSNTQLARLSPPVPHFFLSSLTSVFVLILKTPLSQYFIGKIYTILAHYLRESKY